MFVTVDFKEDYVKAAVADNYAVSVEEVDLSKYSESEIADSLDWYIKKGGGQDIELNNVCAVRKNTIMYSEFEMGSVDSDGKLIPGTEFNLGVLYNSENIAPEEVETLIEKEKLESDPRVIVTTPKQAELLQTTMFYEKFGKGQEMEDDVER